MVLPIPISAMSAGASVPVYTVRTLTWIFFFGLGLEFALAGARFYIIDIWGGVIMTLISIFGCLLIRYEFDLQWTVMFGITIFFYGLIHFVMLLERLIINWGDFPATSGARAIVKDAVFIAAPIVDWFLMGLCLYAYKKATTNAYIGNADEREPLTSSVRSSTFTPFSGQGRKLA